MSFDLNEMTPQEIFDAVVYMKPETMKALALAFAPAAENLDHIVEHGMYPEKYWDDADKVAKEHSYEFVHPKYTKGPQLVEPASKTVH